MCSRKKEGSRYALAGFCFLYAHQGNGVRFGEKKYLRVLDLVHDGLEGLGVVHGQVGEHLAVDLHASLVDEAHELGVAEVLEASGGVDTLDPEGAEVALLGLTVAVGVGQALLPSVLGDGPDVAAAAVVAAGEFQYLLSLGARSDMIY